jgi:hypothetical protein
MYRPFFPTGDILLCYITLQSTRDNGLRHTIMYRYQYQIKL